MAFLIKLNLIRLRYAATATVYSWFQISNFKSFNAIEIDPIFLCLFVVLFFPASLCYATTTMALRSSIKKSTILQAEVTWQFLFYFSFNFIILTNFIYWNCHMEEIRKGMLHCGLKINRLDYIIDDESLPIIQSSKQSRNDAWTRRFCILKNHRHGKVNLDLYSIEDKIA